MHVFAMINCLTLKGENCKRFSLFALREKEEKKSFTRLWQIFILFYANKRLKELKLLSKEDEELLKRIFCISFEILKNHFKDQQKLHFGNHKNPISSL